MKDLDKDVDVVKNIINKHNCQSGKISFIINTIILYAKSTLYPELFLDKEKEALCKLARSFFSEESFCERGVKILNLEKFVKEKE